MLNNEYVVQENEIHTLDRDLPTSKHESLMEIAEKEQDLETQLRTQLHLVEIHNILDPNENNNLNQKNEFQDPESNYVNAYKKSVGRIYDWMGENYSPELVTQVHDFFANIDVASEEEALKLFDNVSSDEEVDFLMDDINRIKFALTGNNLRQTHNEQIYSLFDEPWDTLEFDDGYTGTRNENESEFDMFDHMKRIYVDRMSRMGRGFGIGPEFWGAGYASANSGDSRGSAQESFGSREGRESRNQRGSSNNGTGKKNGEYQYGSGNQQSSPVDEIPVDENGNRIIEKPVYAKNAPEVKWAMDILGLDALDGNPEEAKKAAKKAYRKGAKQYHQDVVDSAASPEAESKMRDLNEANEIMGNVDFSLN